MTERHYLDHAATSPLRPAAREAWERHLGAANPNGQYASGRAARRVLEESREQVAELLGADPVEVVFTSGGTEADNLGIAGLYLGAPGAQIVVPPIEHDAVLTITRHLAAEHWAEIVDLPVGSDGRVDPSRLPELSRRSTAVVACMWANNETGAVQPVADVVAAARAARVPVHIDAVQAVGHEHIDFHALGCTTLALSAHKFGGPRGAGALLVRRDATMKPHTHGGGQERGLRSGTVDVAAAAGLAAGLTDALVDREAETARLKALRDRLRDGILAAVPDAIIHTTEPALPGHLHLSIPGAEGDSLIMLLDQAGIECSTGSACSAGVNRPSHVLLAMGVAESVARGALRFTLGHTSTDADVDAVLAVIGDTVTRARAAGMA